MQQIIGGAILFLIGLVLALFPGKIYQLTEKWKSANQSISASAAYTKLIVTLGIIFSAVGAAVFLCGL